MGMRLDHAGDAMLDTIQDLAFLADRMAGVLLTEIGSELPRAARGRDMAR